MRRFAAMAACGLLIACWAGCKSPVVADQPLTTSPDEPRWVSMGARAFPDDAGKAIYGVGIAAGNRFPDDPFMLRRTAIENGQAAVARQIRALVAAVVKDYSAAAFAPGATEAELQGLTEGVQRPILEATLANAKSSESWRDPQTGDFYVLIKVGLDDVAQQLRDNIATAEKGKLKLDPAAAHKELDRIICNAECQLPNAK